MIFAIIITITLATALILSILSLHNTQENFNEQSGITIIMQPSFGFANRLRCMASAVILAKKLNTGARSARFNATLKLDWIPNHDIAAKWEDIIQTPRWPKPSQRELDAAKPWHSGILREHPTSSIYIINCDHDIKTTNASCKSWIKQKQKFYKSLKPVPAIKSLIDSVKQNYIGVHYRAEKGFQDNNGGQDETRFAKNSPIELFIAEMRQYPKEKFFVCSNDDKAVASLSKRFDVVTLPSTDRGNRETLKGIQHSVAEFFLLSKSKRLIKTYWSSFSDEARIFNRIPATMITLKKRGQYHQLCHETI